MEERDSHTPVDPQRGQQDTTGPRIVFREFFGYLLYGPLLGMAVAASPPEYRPWVITIGMMLWLAAGALLIVRHGRRRRGNGGRGAA